MVEKNNIIFSLPSQHFHVRPPQILSSKMDGHEKDGHDKFVKKLVPE